MSTITTKDGVEIFYKDWGKGRPAGLLAFRSYDQDRRITVTDDRKRMRFVLAHKAHLRIERSNGSRTCGAQK